MDNKWFYELPIERKRSLALQLMSGIYYDFYSEAELMEMFGIDDHYFDNFDYEKYCKYIIDRYYDTLDPEEWNY